MILREAGQSQRVCKHILSNLLCLGRHTVTGMLCTQGGIHHDWSADYRLYSERRVEPGELFETVRQRVGRMIDPDQPMVVSFDDTKIRKTGKSIPGVKYMLDPLGPKFQVNIMLAQRFLQCSVALPEPSGQARMIPIDFLHAPVPVKPRKSATEGEWEAYRAARLEHALPRIAGARLQRVRRQMDAGGDECRELWTVVDGGFTNRNFVKCLPERTTFIGRIRKDAKLFALPEPNRTGRPRVYGERMPTPEALRQDTDIPWTRVKAFAAGKEHEFKIKTLEGLRWKPAGKDHTMRLVVIAPLGYRLRKDGQILYRKPAYLICNNTEADLQKILQAYIWRWDIEVNFRDEKTLLGVGQAQVRHPESVQRVPALAVAGYASMLCAAHELERSGDTGGGYARPKWQRKTPLRTSAQKLIQRLRHEVWASAICLRHFVKKEERKVKSLKRSTNLNTSIFCVNS